MRLTLPSAAAAAVLLLAGPPFSRADQPPARAGATPAAAAALYSEDEQQLLTAGLPTDGTALVEFLRDRSRPDADPQALAALTRRLGDHDPKARGQASAALVRRGVVALPVLRRAANDLADPQRAARARSCIATLEGAASVGLPHAVVRLLALRKPPGTVEALLDYVPAADDEALVVEITSALSTLAYQGGQPNPTLLKSLADEDPLRRAVAGAALC